MDVRKSHSNGKPAEHLTRSDSYAAEMVQKAFARRLSSLAAKQIGRGVLNRIEADDVVQSACASFFRRNQIQPFSITESEELWFILAKIIVRKCIKNRRFVFAGRRSAARERPLSAEVGLAEGLVDREPSPYAVAVAREIELALLESMDGEDRRIVLMFLEGYTGEESAASVGCSERTVRRVKERARARLGRLMEE